MVHVRFAPSPIGSLQVGNALTAVANRRFADEHDAASDARISAGEAQALVRRLREQGADLRALRIALMGGKTGPELWRIVAALPRDEALRRIDAAL
jgi:glutamyl/glutaminyl-tRNA synthetase